MIHMIEGVGAEADQPLLELMFEARKWLFIDLLDWDLEVVDEANEPIKPSGKGKKFLVIAGVVLFALLGGAPIPVERGARIALDAESASKLASERN